MIGDLRSGGEGPYPREAAAHEAEVDGGDDRARCGAPQGAVAVGEHGGQDAGPAQRQGGVDGHAGRHRGRAHQAARRSGGLEGVPAAEEGGDRRRRSAQDPGHRSGHEDVSGHGAGQYPSAVPLTEGVVAPRFTLPSSDGAPRSLDQLTAGGAALLAFFKSTCPVCTLAFPVFGELQRRYGDAVPVVAVSQDPLSTVVPWLSDNGFNGPALDDASEGYAVSKAYEVTTVPTLTLVDDGSVVASSEGWDRDRVNAWARELGERTGRDTAPVSTEDDGRPAFRPG